MWAIEITNVLKIESFIELGVKSMIESQLNRIKLRTEMSSVDDLILLLKYYRRHNYFDQTKKSYQILVGKYVSLDLES